MKKNIIKICLFFTVLVFMLGILRNIFKFKYEDGIYGLDAFYRLEENSVDVLALGSSHAFVDINIPVLYEEYGIAGFDLGGSIQPFWNTYYYLKEALKTQKPRVIILEAYAATQTDMYSDESRIIKNNYGLKFSGNKIESMKISTPEERRDYFFEWIFYHNRYAQINKSDFGNYLGNRNKYEDWKGFYPYYQTVELCEPVIEEIRDDVQMLDKQEEYYRKIIELSKHMGIPLIIIVSPYASYRVSHAELLIHAQRIAEEYGVPFINYNERYEELGLDFKKDWGDAGHLNYLGSEKLTRDIANYLVENYNLEDRRGNPDYQTWKKNAEYYRQSVDNMELREITSLENYLETVLKSDNKYFLIISNYTNAVKWPEWMDWKRGLEQEGTWIVDNKELIPCPEKEGIYFYHKELGDSDLVIKGQRGDEEIIIDREVIYTADDRVAICVWDTMMEEMVDYVWFEKKNNWVGVRD